MYQIILKGGNENCPDRAEFLIASEADLDTLPACAKGSLAYTAGFAEIWHKDLDGNWVML